MPQNPSLLSVSTRELFPEPGLPMTNILVRPVLMVFMFQIKLAALLKLCEGLQLANDIQ